MKLLLFSDLHRDRDAAQILLERTEQEQVDVAIGAGDFATCRSGLLDTLDILRRIPCPLIVVPGNAESDDELRSACRPWEGVHVLHGDQVIIGGEAFFGLGGAVPVTPFGPWSFDLDEATAAAMLQDCPPEAVLVCHSPPYELADRSGKGEHLGSRSIRQCLEQKAPKLVVCGHIHDGWGSIIEHGGTTVINAGPSGVLWELPIDP